MFLVFANLIIIIQTILPIIHSFGKGLCADGIDALIRIGSTTLFYMIFIYFNFYIYFFNYCLDFLSVLDLFDIRWVAWGKIYCQTPSSFNTERYSFLY